MENAVALLLTETRQSYKTNINGCVYYDHQSRSWYKIISSTWLFSSFTYYFGARVADHHHSIDEVRKCTKKESNHIMNCSKKDYCLIRA